MGIFKIKVNIFLIIIGCFPLINYAQDKIKVDSINIEPLEKKAIIGVWPSKVNTVNGIMFNFWFTKYNDDDLLSNKIILPTTNGIEFNFNPIGLITTMMAIPFLFDKESRSPVPDTSLYVLIPKLKKVNGILIASTNMDPTIMNGIEVILDGSHNTFVNGLSIGQLNHRIKLNGVGIGLGNFDTEVKGVQIGLLNTTLHLKGIQIGLWNKNEKRSLPFINWNF